MATNPALATLQFLAGAWDMELSEASFLPDPDARVHGPVAFEWIEQGAALVMRMGGAATPTAAWIIGGELLGDGPPDLRILAGASYASLVNLPPGASCRELLV